MGRLVYGVGINDSDYTVMVKSGGRVTFKCPYYYRWIGMLRRCYSSDKRTSYKDCYVSESWLTFSNFKKWMEGKDWEGCELDKDLVVEGNKCYGEDFCNFVPNYLNQFIQENVKRRGEYKIGVTLDNRVEKRPYQAMIKGHPSGKRHLGMFSTEKEAHNAWLVAKREILQYYKEELEEIDCRIFKRLTHKYGGEDVSI